MTESDKEEIKQLEAELSLIEKERNYKRKQVLSAMKAAKERAGIAPKHSASILETKQVLVNMSKDTNITGEQHLKAISDTKGKPPEWVDDVLSNKPYNFRKAEKMAASESEEIKKAKKQGFLKGADLSGINLSGSLQAALNSYRKGLTQAERLDNVEYLMLELKAENVALKKEQAHLKELVDANPNLLENLSKKQVKEKVKGLLRQGLGAYEVHKQYKDYISYPTIKRYKQEIDEE